MKRNNFNNTSNDSNANQKDSYSNSSQPDKYGTVEPLPESSRPRRDGPGGEDAD